VAQYGTIITNIGLAQIANAQITQTKVGLEYIALGDGNGAHYVPKQNQTALVHEVWRGPIAELSIDPTNSNRIIIDAVIPVTAGGFTIREIGIFDDKNNLIAVGQYPEKYKPQLSEGVSEETLIHFVIETNNADVVKLTIDPTVIIASRNYVDGKVGQVQTALTEHSAEIASPTKLGHIKPDDTTIIVDPETGVASANGGKVKDYSEGHLNDLTETGIYSSVGLHNADRGFPTTQYGTAFIEVWKDDAGTLYQKVYYIGSTGTMDSMYFRVKGGSYAWTTWVMQPRGISNNVDNSADFIAASSYAVKTLNDTKADKLQENFIQAVLSMGTQDSTYPISYYKDSLGRVHVEGQAKSDTSGFIAFQMPVGYRPTIATLVMIPKTTNPAGYSLCNLQTNGYFMLLSGVASSSYSFNLSYKAGA